MQPPLEAFVFLARLLSVTFLKVRYMDPSFGFRNHNSLHRVLARVHYQLPFDSPHLSSMESYNSLYPAPDCILAFEYAGRD